MHKRLAVAFRCDQDQVASVIDKKYYADRLTPIVLFESPPFSYSSIAS